MKLLGSLLCVAVWTGAHAAPCTLDQLATVTALISDAALLQACPTISSTDFLTRVVPCNDAGCVIYLSSHVSGKLPDCEVDDGYAFKDLYAAFVGVCKDNAAAAQPMHASNTSTIAVPTNSTTTTPTTNTTMPSVAYPTTIPTTFTTLMPVLNGTNTTTSENTTSGSTSGIAVSSSSDADSVGASANPVVPAPTPTSRAARLPLVGTGAVITTAMFMVLIA